MNILFINTIPFNPTFGGIERVTDILTKSLIKKNYKIFYLSGNQENNNFHNYNFPVPSHILPENGLFFSEKNIKYLREFVETNKIDIIINQRGLEKGFNNLLEITSTKKISVLHSSPNAFIKIYSKVFYKPTTYLILIKNIIKACLYPLSLYHSKIKAKKQIATQFNYITQNSDAIVLLSSQYKKEFFSYNIKRKDIPIISIPNPNTYAKQKINWSKKEKIILFVGRLETLDKNPIELLKIWQKLYRIHPNWKLIYIGEGSAKKELQAYTIKNNILRVYFKGQQEDVSKFYKIASFICLTSNFEGWGMSLTEGMSFGCIPFTYNNFKAASDIIDNGINGYIIKAYNKKEYAKKLDELMSNESKRIKMGKEAISKVQKFDANNIISRWIELFNSLIS